MHCINVKYLIYQIWVADYIVRICFLETNKNTSLALCGCCKEKLLNIKVWSGKISENWKKIKKNGVGFCWSGYRSSVPWTTPIPYSEKLEFVPLVQSAHSSAYELLPAPRKSTSCCELKSFQSAADFVPPKVIVYWMILWFYLIYVLV